MPLKCYTEHHPYGDTYAEEQFIECDGECNHICLEQECDDAKLCDICKEPFCKKENKRCPNNCDPEYTDFIEENAKEYKAKHGRCEDAPCCGCCGNNAYDKECDDDNDDY